MASEVSEAVTTEGAEDRSLGSVCRICFDDSSSGELVAPCQCRGTQALVHKACLLKWRRLQVIQGKVSAASKCEVCGSKYAASLASPGRPWHAVVFDFLRVLSETTCGLVVYFCSCRSPLSWLVLIVACARFGLLRIVVTLTIFFPCFVLMLYCQGSKLSVLGTPGHNMHLGFTSFGPPVEGLCKGMLLVSIRAGGPFRKTALYVIEHSDHGTLAVILNKTLSDVQNAESSGSLTLSLRTGGPVQLQGFFCIHDVANVPGAERLLRNEALFLNRNLHSLQTIQSLVEHGDGHDDSHLVILKGVSSWGEHQLEGEVRRGAWGWIPPEHVKPEDILEKDTSKLELQWRRLVNSPHLEIFQE